jgi:hypothetical protein
LKKSSDARGGNKGERRLERLHIPQSTYTVCKGNYEKNCSIGLDRPERGIIIVGKILASKGTEVGKLNFKPLLHSFILNVGTNEK